MKTSPSAIARAGAGSAALTVSPSEQITLTKPCYCGMCGITVQAGEAACPWNPPKGFNNGKDMAAQGSPIVCVDCKAINNKKFMQNFANCVITSKGFWKAGSTVNRAYFLQTPPTEAFLFIAKHGSKLMQHLIWRAPVNHDPRIIKVLFADTILTIRHSVLLEAIQRGLAHAERVEQEASVAGRKKKVSWPFFCGLELEKTNGAGRLHPQISSEDRKFFSSLSLGELWATYNCLLATKELSPKPPELILSSST